MEYLWFISILNYKDLKKTYNFWIHLKYIAIFCFFKLVLCALAFSIFNATYSKRWKEHYFKSTQSYQNKLKQFFTTLPT